MLPSRTLVLLVVAVLCAALPGRAAAAGTPDISATVSSATVLYAAPAHVTLAASNPSGPGFGFNLSYRVVLPAGVAYAGGSTVAPTQIANQPTAGATTLIFSNVSDLSPNSAQTLGFDVSYSPAAYDVGDTFDVTAQAFVNSNPRIVPKFDASGAPAGGSTGSAGPVTGTQTITAVKVTKDEPSAEGEILRGVHDHQTVYTLKVENNSVHTTDGSTLVDYLPAGLEFLGCGAGGTATDHTTDAPTNPGSPDEYAGSGPIVIPPLSGCVDPDDIATVNVDPDGAGPLPLGVYTLVTWDVGTLAPGATKTFPFRAAVPLRANTTTFTGPEPTPASLGQAANLDNNSGPEVADETQLTNLARVDGTYEGSLPKPVSDNTTLTRTAEDWLIHKTASDDTLAEGAVTTWTLTLQSSEYHYVTGATITDTLPNGLCPLGATNLTSQNDAADSECDPTGDLPSAPYTSATENLDGTWTLTWDDSKLAALGHTSVNDTITLTFPTKTRSHYQQNFLPATPILTRDTIENNVTTQATQFARCTAPGTSNCLVPGPKISNDTDDTPVTDASSASQTSPDPTIDKQVAASGTNCQTATYVDTIPHYHPGDRVCWLVRVLFPANVDTAPQTIEDFLPPDSTYETGSEAAGPGNNVTSVLDDSNALTDGLLTWTVTGSTVPSGSQVFSRVFSSIATPLGTPAPGDIAGNLLKFSSINSDGVSDPQRDLSAYVIDTPVVSLLKGVSTVVRGGSTVIGPLPANSDNVPVEGGDQVTYRVDVANSGGQDAANVQVRDILPLDYQCPLVPGPISDGGTCVDGGLNADQIRWTVPTIAAGTTKTLTYTVTVPADIEPGRTLDNKAGVRQFEGLTNLGGSYTYTPADNIDPTDTATPNAPAADDPSSVHTNDATVVKARTTSVTAPGNDVDTQATIGEQITYTLTATVPAETTLGGTAQLTDAVDSSTRQPYVPGSATATLDGGPLPAGFTLDTSGPTPKVIFPIDYTAPGPADTTVLLTFKTVVADVPANTRTSGDLTNQGTLSWTDPVAGAQSRNSATLNTQIVEPLIAQAKVDDRNPARVQPGEIITYTVTTSNPSAPGRISPAYDVATSDLVPVGLTPIDAGGAPLNDGAGIPGVAGAVWNAGPRTITRTVPEIDPGATSSYTYRVKVDNPQVGGSIKTNTVTATATSMPGTVPGERASGTGYGASESDTVQIGAATITKDVSPTSATIGDPVTYTLHVTIPAGIALFDTTVVDTVPDSIDVNGYGPVTCETGCGTVIPVNKYTPVVAGTTTLAWDLGDITPLATAQTIALTYSGHVRATHRIGGANVVAGQKPTNSATVSSNRTDKVLTFDPATIPTGFDDTSTPATAQLTIVEPKLTIDKKVSVDGGAFVDGPVDAQANSALTYELLVKNIGTSPAYDVQVTDRPDTELTNVVLASQAGVTVTDGWTALDPSVAWSIDGPIAPGATVTLTYTANIIPAGTLSDGQTIDNTGSIPHYFGVPKATRIANPTVIYRDYTDGGGDSVKVILDFPTFTTVKTTGAAGFPDTANAEIGQPFPWRIVATNTASTASASAVHITDTLPPNWTYDAGSAVVGGFAQEPMISTAPTGDTLDWTVASLAAGTSVTVTFTAHPLPAAAADPGTGAAANINSAKVSSAKDNAGNSGNQTPYGSLPDTATATLLVPALTIAKTPDGGAATAGSPASFSIAIKNAGNAIARHLDIADVLPAGLTYTAGSASASPSAGFSETSIAAGPGAGQTTIHWAIASLAAGNTVTITVPVTVDASVADTTTLTNTSSVTSDELPTPVADPGSLLVSTSADMAIDKTGAATYTAGTHYTWHLRVRNLGPSDAQNVSVSDTLPTGTTFVSATAPCTQAAGIVTCNVTTAPAGFDETYDVTVAVDPSTTVSPLANTATVSTTTSDPAGNNNSSTSTATPDPLADVSVTKVANPAAILHNGSTTFTITVHNAGPSVARNVALTDTMPAGLTLISATGPGCTTAADTVTCAIGDLGVGVAADQTITVVAKGTTNGIWTNTATATTTTPQPQGGGDPDSGDAEVTVGPVADLKLTKTAPATVAAGGELTWTLTVTNNGPDPATGVAISDPLPAGMTVASADPGCTDTAGTVTCAIGDLAVGESATRMITAVAPIALADSTVVNTATATSDEGSDRPGDNTSSSQTLVGPSADLEIVKTGPATVPAAGTIAWTLVATNHGPSTARGVTVADVLPEGVTLVSATPTQGTCSAVQQTISCSLGALAPAGAAQIQVVGSVAAALQATNIVNTSTITGDQPDPAPGNNSSSLTTAVGAPDAGNFNLTLVKTVLGSGQPVLGAALRYALAVTNSGPAVATDVVITDTLPSDLEFIAATVPGGTCSESDRVVRCHVAAIAAGQTVTAIITTRPITPGPIRNHASVASAVSDTNASDNVAGAGTVVHAPRASLRLTKTTTRRSPVKAGDHVQYKIKVTNRSTAATDHVVVCDRLPAALVIVSAPGAKLRAGRPCWTIALLRAHQSKTFSLTVRVTTSARPGRLTNTATATAPHAARQIASAHVTVSSGAVLGQHLGGGVTG